MTTTIVIGPIPITLSNPTKKKTQWNKEVSKTQVKDQPKLVIGVNYWRMLTVKKINHNGFKW